MIQLYVFTIYSIYINSTVITDFVNLQFTTFNLLFVLLYCLHFPKKKKNDNIYYKQALLENKLCY